MAIFAVVRAVHLASLMTVFGACAYILLLRSQAHTEIAAPGLRVFFASAATLALVTAIAGLGFVAGQMSGDWRGAFDPGALEAVITDTRFGQVFLGRIVGLIVLLVAWVFGSRSQIPLSMLLAAMLLGALALTSHAAASGGDASGIVRAANDMIHLLTGGFWLGGLLVLSALMRQHRNEPAKLLGPIRIFSTWGMYVVVILVVTGIANAFSILPINALSPPRGNYVELLLTKVGIASVMIVLAAVNRWHFAPALSEGGEARAPLSLSRSIGVEVALGLAVVCIAGYLGVMPPR